MENKEIIICRICNKESTIYGIANHVRLVHSITRKEYFDLYIKQEGEGKCLCCGNEAIFFNMHHGYRDVCSKECAKILGTQRNKESKLRNHGNENYNGVYIDASICENKNCRKEFVKINPNQKFCCFECRKTIAICLNCGNEFKQYKQIKKFCCNNCRSQYAQTRRNNKKKVCIGCGHEFVYKKNKKYCSKKCKFIHKEKQYYEYRKCLHCEKEFYIRKKQGNQYCSDRCSRASISRREKAREQLLTKNPMDNKESRNKIRETKKQRYGDENYNNIEQCKQTCLERYGYESASQHPDVRRKLRFKTLNRIQDRIGEGFQITPNYNSYSIPILESVAKEFNINDLQHAENGGEYRIKELGYWVDGYSKEKNIVIEYDEKHHFNTDGTYKEKDLIRQTEIIGLLKCKIIRIKYDGSVIMIE